MNDPKHQHAQADADHYYLTRAEQNLLVTLLRDVPDLIVELDISPVRYRRGWQGVRWQSRGVCATGHPAVLRWG